MFSKKRRSIASLRTTALADDEARQFGESRAYECAAEANSKGSAAVTQSPGGLEHATIHLCSRRIVSPGSYQDSKRQPTCLLARRHGRWQLRRTRAARLPQGSAQRHAAVPMHPPRRPPLL